MPLYDRDRAGQTFEVGDAVRRALAGWAKERDSEIGRLNLRRAYDRMNEDEKAQLVLRLAEISLGLLYVLERARRR